MKFSSGQKCIVVKNDSCGFEIGTIVEIKSVNPESERVYGNYTCKGLYNGVVRHFYHLERDLQAYKEPLIVIARSYLSTNGYHTRGVMVFLQGVLLGVITGSFKASRELASDLLVSLNKSPITSNNYAVTLVETKVTNKKLCHFEDAEMSL